ncbi:VWA domain-containing protein [Cardiobacterium hominis]|uniref:VWA domain-containing protein n=1 Tax=Cardiobacterium hominis TaxID=2718 RepID=UPI0006612E27|nr:VWA domain-containing protein [Cardiobacterium hominis]
MITPTEQQKRWRLILGSDAENSCPCDLDDAEIRMDKALAALYDTDSPAPGKRRGGLGASAPKVSAWLGDIREYFPQSVVQIMQKDAIERLNLKTLLTEKEMLANITPDVHLVATLMSLSSAIPEKNRTLARQIVQKVVDELTQKLQAPTQQAVLGALNRAIRTRNPRYKEIDWHRTIQKNLKNYQPEYQSIIPEVRIGYGRKRKAVRDLILCLDQSGSMGTSVIYSGIFGAVLASLPALRTRMVVFDTAVVDLSDQINDPVELLFGVQLGGGTDIDQALAYCQSQITRPTDTTLVLVTDLEEGGNAQRMRKRMAELVASGVQFIVLLALNDDGAPYYDKNHAEYLASLGVPAFACTPDHFPDLMAAALNKQDLSLWVAEHVKA